MCVHTLSSWRSGLVGLQGQTRIAECEHSSAASPSPDETTAYKHTYTIYNIVHGNLLVGEGLMHTLHTLDLSLSLSLSLSPSREVAWSHKFKDSILDIVGTESGKIILGLADGDIAVLKVSAYVNLVAYLNIACLYSM